MSVSEESEVESTASINIPAGYQHLNGVVDNDFVDGGHLQNMQVMFKLYEDEWCHFHVLKFIAVEDRPADSSFTYVAKIIGVAEENFQFSLTQANTMQMQVLMRHVHLQPGLYLKFLLCNVDISDLCKILITSNTRQSFLM